METTQSCKYNWFNLPFKIKKEIILPLKDLLPSRVYKKEWFILPKNLVRLYDEMIILYNQFSDQDYAISRQNFIWFDLPKKVENLCILSKAIVEITQNLLIKSISLSTECVENTNEITIYGYGFSNVTNVIINDTPVLSFNVIDNNYIVAIPSIIIEYPAINQQVSVKVETNTQTAQNSFFSVTNNFEVAEIYIEETAGEADVCVGQTYTLSCETALGEFKTLSTDYLELNNFEVTPLKEGIAYIYYDITGAPECGRGYLKLNIKPAITINSSPQQEVRIAESNVVLKVVADNVASYQWQVSDDGGVTFTNISNNSVYSGVTTEALTISGITIGLNENGYKCVLNGISPCSTEQTNSTLLLVTEEVGIVSHPTNVTTTQGQNIQFNVVAEGNPLTYTWFEDNGFGAYELQNDTRYSGVNTDTLNISDTITELNGYNYYVVITSTTETIQSNTSVLTVN